MLQKKITVLLALFVVCFGSDCGSSASLSSPWYCHEVYGWVYPEDLILEDTLSLSSGTYQFAGDLTVVEGATLAIQENATVSVNGTLTFEYGSYLVTVLSNDKYGIEIAPLTVEGCTFFNGSIIINDTTIESVNDTDSSSTTFESTTSSPANFSGISEPFRDSLKGKSSSSKGSKSSKSSSSKSSSSKTSSSYYYGSYYYYSRRGYRVSSSGSSYVLNVSSKIIDDICASGDFSRVSITPYTTCSESAAVHSNSSGVFVEVGITCYVSSSSYSSYVAVIVIVVSVIVGILLGLLRIFLQKRDSSSYGLY